MPEFIVISPDGFTIHPEETYPTKLAAESALTLWTQRYERQGYYSSATHGRIPIDMIAGYCEIIPLPPDDGENQPLPTPTYWI